MMGKPHLSFLMTVGLCLTVELGLDISVTGFKEHLLMSITDFERHTHPVFQFLSPTLSSSTTHADTVFYVCVGSYCRTHWGF